MGAMQAPGEPRVHAHPKHVLIYTCSIAIFHCLEKVEVVELALPHNATPMSSLQMVSLSLFYHMNKICLEISIYRVY